MFLAYIRKIFGGEKEVPTNEQFYSPLRIAMHSTVKVSMVDWLGTLAELNKDMAIPSSDMSVIAIGKIVDSGNEIYNFYLKDNDSTEFTLQLFCSPNDNGKGMAFREATLYHDVECVAPFTEDVWEAELKCVGEHEYDFGGNKYTRVWSNSFAGKIRMVAFDETVLHGDDTLHYTNSVVLYSRDLVQSKIIPQKELLLVGVEEGDDSAQLTTQIGLSIPLNAIKVQ